MAHIGRHTRSGRGRRSSAVHLGGAWKVAYADLVTALMALFLVMWLVTQNGSIKAAVAGYFREPGIFDYEKSKGLVAGGPIAPNAEPSAGSNLSAEAQAASFERAAKEIRDVLSDAPRFGGLRDQIELKVTADGLRIELVDSARAGFFDTGSAVLNSEAERLVTIIARELSTKTSSVIVEGHTDSRPYAGARGYNNWELSTDRANAARRVMEQAGLDARQLRGVRGYADTVLRVPGDRLDPRNRRISIVVR